MFVFLLRCVIFVKSILVPVLRFLPAAKSRIEFENLNDTDPYSIPWRHGPEVSWAFHFSSEGELEQLKPLIKECLDQSENIELLYTSPSVERKVQQLAGQYPKTVRILRLPLISSLKLESWSRAESLMMCRYDFFPSLLLLKVKKRILVWASLKGKKNSWWLAQVYARFDLVIAATKEQAQRIASLGISNDKIWTYDFRPAQIQQRLQNLSASSLFSSKLSLRTKSERLIMGSVWPHDLHLLKELFQLETKLHIWLAPHALDQAGLMALKDKWQELYPSVPLVSASNDDAVASDQMAWLIESPGHLLEMYGEFNLVYVGGGFGRSIHSVLEPLVAGCWSACGPRTHRSTEIDLGNELSPGQISVVHTTSEMAQWWQQVRARENALKDDNRRSAIHNWIEQSREMVRRVLAH